VKAASAINLDFMKREGRAVRHSLISEKEWRE